MLLDRHICTAAHRGQTGALQDPGLEAIPSLQLSVLCRRSLVRKGVPIVWFQTVPAACLMPEE